MAIRIEMQMEQTVAVLTIHYDRSLSSPTDSRRGLGKELVERYQQAQSQPRPEESRVSSCVVDLRTKAADSALIRALVDLWREVVAHGGRLICVGYPEPYLHSLKTLLGVPDHKTFLLAKTTAAAVEQARTAVPVGSLTKDQSHA
jgi:hypothetical protein